MTRNLAADLARLAPNASKAIIAGIVANQHFLDEADISTPIRLRHFFARVCVETGGLRYLEENLSYSAKRMTEVWPKRFPTISAAKPYANNPAMLAEKVYGGRLGNKKPGDGWAFRGSGLLQDTGRDNFEEVEAITGMPVASQPDLLRTFPGALQAATIYWKSRSINARADRNDTSGVCKAVNGGTNGLADQKVWLAKAEKVWPDSKSLGLLSIPDPAPVVPDPPTKETIEAVQNRLKDLGYNPGGADGKLGPLTRGAILSFKNDTEGLMPNDTIDAAFLAALATASPRKMPDARANATQAQVAAVVPEVRTNLWTKIGAFFTGICALIGSFFDGILGNLGSASGYIQPLKDAAGDVPGWVWMLAIALVAGGLFLIARHGAAKGVEAFQSGERR